MNLTPEIVYKALAANPYGKPQTAKTWKDVDPSLPAKPILVYGPPSTSGTRDALKELILTEGLRERPGDEGAQGQRQGRSTSRSAPKCAATAPMSTRASRTT